MVFVCFHCASVVQYSIKAVSSVWSCRSYRRGGDPPLAPPLAPVSSTNDSEVSSDALTDDAMSVTDSSV